MNALEIIATKRDGGRLSDEQIDWFITNYAAGGVIADEQASALAMAIFLNGMEPDELARWTRAMIESGERLDLSAVGRPTVDKHSTGGVGDKVSLILVPLVAACGAAVPQLSGRGLGHTGGTLDKMESIEGWTAQLDNDRMVAQLDEIGAVIAGASPTLAPADRKLYALRDVTSTVESIPLIASSIMSKKVAEGTGALVLDVKYGTGAFLPEPERGRLLAETMVGIGEANGVRTAALLTAMDTVLGRTAGNALEVQESIDVLEGGGPADVIEVTVALAEVMLELVGIDADPAAVLASGAARPVFDAMVAAQGGRLEVPLPVADHVATIEAESTGVVTALDARAVGVAAWRLGAGRARKEDPVDPAAGMVCLAKPGDEVEAGDPVLELHSSDPALVPLARDVLAGAVTIGTTAPEPAPLVLDRIG